MTDTRRIHNYVSILRSQRGNFDGHVTSLHGRYDWLVLTRAHSLQLNSAGLDCVYKVGRHSARLVLAPCPVMTKAKKPRSTLHSVKIPNRDGKSLGPPSASSQSPTTPKTPKTPKTPADEGIDFFESAFTHGEKPINVYELRLDPDGGPSKDTAVEYRSWFASDR